MIKNIYNFTNFSHPFIGDFITRLNRGELSDFMRSDLEIEKIAYDENRYKSTSSFVKDINFFDKKIDFSTNGAYSIYNWEIFYHIPITIAVHLSKNQRFEEAEKWFHFIFNPLTNEKEDSDNPTARYWNFKDFREHTDITLVTKLMEELAEGKDTQKITDLKNSIKAWEKTPFDPHTVAKFRPVAYQLDVVMKYVDNLIAWGDSLFRKFTIESLNEATQFYVLASNILGDKPKETPNMLKHPKITYCQIKDNCKIKNDEAQKKLDEFSNFMIEMENEYPIDLGIEDDSSGVSNPNFNSTSSPYFCIPKNPKLLAYWDLVEDRLFKIRHCMDIEGKVRQIPLFQPSIDPGMLVKAAGKGMNVSDIVSGVNEPHSHVKFVVLAQKATELINEVKSLGNSLLSAIEKGDNERLALLRQTQEIKVLELSQDLKFLQWKETESSIESLIKTRESAYLRYKHYQILLGKEESEFSNLESFSLESKEISEENFDDLYSELVENYTDRIDLEDYREEKMGMVTDFVASTGINLSLDLLDVSKNLSLNKGEEAELNVYSPLATRLEVTSSMISAAMPFLATLPQVRMHISPWGVGPSIESGGSQLTAVASSGVQLLNIGSSISSKMGQQSLKLASYQRRIDDWVLQSNLAAKELEQIGRQIITSSIREQISKKEYKNHQIQIENSKAIDIFMKEKKFGTEELYLWMQGETSKIYYEFYKLAFDMAKKAEATMKYELSYDYLDEQDFIKFNYWDTGRKGLLAGESLALDMKKMELAYLEANKRELELTKHISLQQLNPIAILSLKTTGSCIVNIPEWLFDMETAGHYMRRIKTISLSIPCVVGTYTSINCTLTLEKSGIRNTTLGDYSTRDETNFKESFHSESIVTSGAQNDSGVFELNLRDEKYLPFEGAGAISTWRLELPTEFPQFDYDTISDVIMHMRYTARGDGVLKGKANTSLANMFKEATSTPLVRVFSLKHDFSNEWHEFKESESKTEMTLEIRKEHFPYFVQGRNITTSKINMLSEDIATTIEHNKQFTLEASDLFLEITLTVKELKEEENIFLLMEYSVG